MTHADLTATASRLFDSGMLTQADSREAARIGLSRKLTRRDKQSLSDLVRRYPQALNTDRQQIKP